MLKLPAPPDLFAKIDPRWNGFIYAVFVALFAFHRDYWMVSLSLICAGFSAIMVNMTSERFYYLNDLIYVIWIVCFAIGAIDHDILAFGILPLIYLVVYIPMRIIRERTSVVKTYQWKWPMNQP